MKQGGAEQAKWSGASEKKRSEAKRSERGTATNSPPIPPSPATKLSSRCPNQCRWSAASSSKRSKGMGGAIAKAEEIVATLGADGYLLQQFNNPDNPSASDPLQQQRGRLQ